MLGRVVVLLVFVWLPKASASAQSTQATLAQIEFFEKRIRPLLVEHCYSCHSKDAKRELITADFASTPSPLVVSRLP